MPENLGEARLRLTADTKKLDSALKKASANMKKVGLGMAAVGVAIAAPIVAATKIFAEYEQSMANVQSVSKATAKEFKALDAIAKQMGRTTVFTARESAEALFFMSKAGMKVEDSVAALPHVLNLAAAGQLELGQAADIVTNIMAGYGVATEDLSLAVDVLTKGFTSANTDLEQLGQAFIYAGPVAKAAGIAFNETAAALALMGNAGYQGTVGGTALRGAITRLLNPTAEAGEILHDMGVEVMDAEGNMRPLVDIIGQLEAGGLTAGDAMILFGQRAGPAMLALIEQGSGALQELRTEMDNSAGTAQSIADIQLDTLNGDILLLKSAFEGLALTIGGVVVPELRKIMQHVTPIIQAVGDWTDKNPELTKKLVILGVVVAAILIVFGGLLVGVGFLAAGLAALAAGPVLLAIGGFAALVGAVVAAIWKWDELDQFVKTWKTALPQDVYEAFEGVRTPLETFYGALDVLEGRLADIAAPMILKLPQDVYEAFEGVRTPLEVFYGVLDVLKGTLG